MNINIGDLINQTSFTHYTPNLQVRFAAPKGRVAMMLLLGDADKKAPETFDATAALNNLGWIAETELDAAQSQLAALREELATSKRNEHNSEVAYKAAIEKQDELRDRKNSIVDLQQRLADAERRNAVMASALKFYADKDHFSTDDELNWDSCSGEPSNILWHESEPWFIEDGSIARAALNPKPEAASHEIK